MPRAQCGRRTAASAVFCDGLDAVPYSSEAWSDPSVLLDVDSILERAADAGQMPLLPLVDPAIKFRAADGLEPPDAPDAGMSRSAALGELIRSGRVEAPAAWWTDGDFWVPPISGGAPDPEEWAQACATLRQPYQPTAEDLAEMDAWCARIDAFDAERRAEDARNPMHGYE
jgi:hypothetical protein